MNVQVQESMMYDEEDENQVLVVICPRSTDDIKGTNDEPEVPTLTIAEVKEYDFGDSWKYFFVEDVTVTYSDPQGEDDEYALATIEDETGALIVYVYAYFPDYAAQFNAGTKISGLIMGAYAGENALYAYADYSQFEEVDADVTFGAELTDAEILADNNAYRLVTITAPDENPIVGDPEDGTAMITENIIVYDVFDVFGEDYTLPEAISKVTGIIIPLNPVAVEDDNDEPIAENMVLIAPRNTEDIVKGEGNAVDTILNGNLLDGPVYNLNGVKVGDSIKDLKNLDKGIYILNGKKVLVK